MIEMARDEEDMCTVCVISSLLIYLNFYTFTEDIFALS